jgi:hypothetical protein
MTNVKPMIVGWLCVFAAFTSCTSQKQVSTPDEWKGNFIRFGKGGGFAGKSTVFVLLENGQIFAQQAWSNTYKQIPGINRKNAKHIFGQASNIVYPNTPINEPGNVFKELQVSLKAKKIHLIWSDGNAAITPEINELHQKLFSLIKN